MYARSPFAAFLALALAPVAHAQFLYRYSFGSQVPLVHPHDVAVYAPLAEKQYVFVTDNGSGNLVRFDDDGFNSSPPLVVPVTSPWLLEAVAVNDIPGHCNYGQVYVTRMFAAGTGPNLMISVLDVNGTHKMDLVPTMAPNLYGPTGRGIDCDADGNVYVTDSIRQRTLRFDAQHFDPSLYGTSLTVAPDQVFDDHPDPRDVSVDLEGFVHVTHMDDSVVVYRPDGTIARTYASSSSNADLWGIDAAGPGRHTWVVYGDVERFSGAPSGVEDPDVVTGTTGLSAPYGLDYDKFLGHPVSLWWIRSNEERVFVVDSGNHEIDVFGQETLSTILPPNAVAWWRFNEVQETCAGTLAIVEDAAGDHDGVVTGTFPPPETCEGAVAGALRFPGFGEKVVVQDSDSLDFGVGNFTIEGWVRLSSTSGVHTLLDKRSGDEAGYSVYVYDGNIGIQVNGGSNVYDNWTNMQGWVADGAWHYFAFCVDRNAAMVRGYLDGNAALDPLIPELAGLSTDNDAPLLIGEHNYFSSYDFAGSIDELTLYSRALSPMEIDKIWVASYAGKHKPWIPPSNHCTAGVSTNACVATLSWAGIPSASSGSGFVITAGGVEGQKQGLMFYGISGQSSSPWATGSTSFFCVKAPTQRMGTQSSGGTANLCDGVLSIDWNAFIAANPTALGNPFSPGAVVDAQVWYRDPPAPKTTNLSDGLEFVVQP